ncbi:response regulator transcription factor [Sphingobacterium sp. WOUb80]|uniref:response regulator transcription factor n=1 Tax=Sphingobacterium sp. WOUb80 TaxID=3234028 RepID=UPI003CF7BBEC
MQTEIGRKIKIAFVDDCLLQRTLMKIAVVNHEAFDLCFNCSNGLALLKELERTADLPDVCLADLHMPFMNGHEAALHISDKYPSIKLFGYTTTDNILELERFKANGALFIFDKTNPRMTLEEIKFWFNDDI